MILNFFLGLWGLIAAAIFRSDGILLTGSSEAWNMLLWNVIGAICLILFHATVSGVMFKTLSKLDLFRVSPSAEMAGLDIVKHNEPAYGFGTGLPSTIHDLTENNQSSEIFKKRISV